MKGIILAGRSGTRSTITFINDRPGHDCRYAMDPSKIETQLGWTPQESRETERARTVAWYVENESWWTPIHGGAYGGSWLGSLVVGR